MEQEKMKRARERDEETGTPSLENSSNNNNKAKKRDLHGINLMKENQKQKDLEAEKASSKTPPPPPWDSVFDFPWLKDGVMSKTEEDFFLDFEDKFSSSLLHHEDGFHFSEAYCICETPEASKMVGEAVFESDGLEIKAEDVDCIWSSLIQ